MTNREAKLEAGKFPVDVALVRRLVAKQFPQWADLPIRPVTLDGWDNWTFHLGERMKVRLPSAQGYAEQAAKESHWLPRLIRTCPSKFRPRSRSASRPRATHGPGPSTGGSTESR